MDSKPVRRKACSELKPIALNSQLLTLNSQLFKMIIRIVKMTFQPDEVANFLNIFNGSRQFIRSKEGCIHLELLNDINASNIFFTYSHWNSETDLNNYRKSELFENVWGKTKVLFAAKAEAWSVISMTNP